MPRVQGRTGAAKVTKTIFACAFTGKPDRFPHGLGRLSGSLEGASDLHGWRKCKGIVGNNPCLPLRVDARLGCAPLSLLSLASPGLAFLRFAILLHSEVRGRPSLVCPFAGGERPLDPRLYPAHPWRARSAGQRSTGPLSRSASPLSPPYSIGTMYGDVQVPRAQDARERPRLSVRRKTALVPTAHRSRLTGHGHGLTIGAKTSTARCAKAVRARFIWPVCVENPGSLVSGYEKQN